MNKKELGIIAFILFLALPGFTQKWHNTNAEFSKGRYDDIYFHSPDTGWAVNGDGKIIKTLDGGNSWIELFNKPELYFRSVEFLDENIGFAGTLNKVLLKTVDGGNTWEEIQDLIPTPIKGICGMSHVGNNVYGVGIYSHPAYFIKSTDKGKTWIHKDLSEFAHGMVECHFIDENLGFISGINEDSGGIILKTTDGGENWSVVLDTKNGAEYIWKLDFVTEKIAYGSVIAFSGGATNIVKSLDGGDSWTIHQVDTGSLGLEGIGFINEKRGWVGPYTEPMYETNDGGLTWTRTDLYPNINRFFRLNSELMYASGSSVYKYSDSTTSIHTTMSKRHPHAITSVTPNPFVNNINFSIDIAKQTSARIDLFSASGQHLKNFYSGRINVGTHPFRLNTNDIDNISSGLYYIVLRTDEGFLSTPIIKGNVD